MIIQQFPQSRPENFPSSMIVSGWYSRLSGQKSRKVRIFPIEIFLICNVVMSSDNWIILQLLQTSTELDPEAILLLEEVSVSAPGGAEIGAELGQSRVFWRGSLSLVSFSPMEACLNQDIFLLLLLGGFPFSVREPDSCVVAIVLLCLSHHFLVVISSPAIIKYFKLLIH